MSREPVAGDPWEKLREHFDVEITGDGLNLRCRRCGHQEHYTLAYHPSYVVTDAVTHEALCTGKPYKPPVKT